MSPSDFKRTRLNKHQARKLIARLSLEESVTFSGHAFDRMHERNIDIQDVWNVLETSDSYLLGEGELENGSYRYLLCTNRIRLVISFNSDGTKLIIVTVVRR